MLTINEKFIFYFLIFWVVLAFTLYFVWLKCIEKEYKKFYPNPLVNVVLSLKDDQSFKPRERWIAYVSCGIIFLPIMLEWLICWSIYRLCLFLVNEYVKTVATNHAMIKDTSNNSNSPTVIEEGVSDDNNLTEDSHQSADESAQIEEVFVEDVPLEV